MGCEHHSFGVEVWVGCQRKLPYQETIIIRTVTAARIVPLARRIADYVQGPPKELKQIFISTHLK
jgi:hypothetical protein